MENAAPVKPVNQSNEDACPAGKPLRSSPPEHRPSQHLFRCNDGDLVAADRSGKRPGPAACAAHAAFSGFVSHPDYPCVGAKSALARSSYLIGLYPSMSQTQHAPAVVDDLRWFGEHSAELGDSYVTFMAVFESRDIGSPERFESALWSYLQAMNRYDSLDCAWDPSVSDNPSDPEFSFSVGGKAYFVIGLHPSARREARRFPFPMLVFNLHSQFEELREAGKFERLRSTIRSREVALEGKPNPLLKDFGTSSEAAQYAGCPHASGWSPPFRAACTNPRTHQGPTHPTDHEREETENRA